MTYSVGDRVEIFTEGFPVPANYRGKVAAAPVPNSIVMLVQCDDEQDRFFILEDTRKEGGPIDGEFRVLFQAKAGGEWQLMRQILPTRALADEVARKAQAKWKHHAIRVEEPSP